MQRYTPRARKHGLPSAVSCSVETVLMSFMAEIVIKRGGLILNVGVLVSAPNPPDTSIF